MTGDPAPLTDEMRNRVIQLAAAALGVLPDDEVPRALRPFARFTASRRARAAAGVLAAALEEDPEFRRRVADSVKDDPLAAAVAAGTVPPAADPALAAALAYLLRPDGWTAVIERARVAADDRARRAADDAAGQRLRLLSGQLADLREQMREQARRSRAELSQAAAEVDSLHRELREQVRKTQQAAAESRRAAAALAAERQRAAASQSRLEADLRRIRTQLAAAEAAADAARRGAREGRAGDEARLWLLLDTVVNAAQGLRRELALTPSDERPADSVAAATGAAADEPGRQPRLAALLTMPRVHLIVDGYNVTKSGYGDLPLEAQRHRRRVAHGCRGGPDRCRGDRGIRRRRAPACRTCVPRGVRVLFSKIGETADDLIGRLVGAEPPGRALAVVSSDREVADAAGRAGAYPVASAVLLAHLEQN
ncbi:MAG: NYN domain-containing protein [Pseudonocardiales bacterium]